VGICAIFAYILGLRFFHFWRRPRLRPNLNSNGLYCSSAKSAYDACQSIEDTINYS